METRAKLPPQWSQRWKAVVSIRRAGSLEMLSLKQKASRHEILDPRVSKSARERFGLCFIVAAATVPFLGKAFHIDDPLYLAVARQILAKPWDPFGAEILWEKSPEYLFDADFNPPLWNYLMAGVLAITGEPTVTTLDTDAGS